MFILQGYFRKFRLLRLKRTIILVLSLIAILLVLHLLWLQTSFDYSEERQMITSIKTSIDKRLNQKKSKLITHASNIAVDEFTHAPNIAVDEFFNSTSKRSDYIVQAMKHSWKAYRDFAWGKDEVYPLTNGSSVWMGAALTMIDSLDLLYIMNMTAEFNECINWITSNLQFTLDKSHTNVFETIIRILGGLLSAYNLSKEPVLLDKAKDLGDRLLPAFNSPTGIPYSDINLKSRIPNSPSWTQYSSTAEAYTVILELFELSRVSNNETFKKTAETIVNLFLNLTKSDALVPIYIDPSTGKFSGGTITFGARGDSYYEYLLKYWIQTGKKNRLLYREYLRVVEEIKKRIVHKTKKSGLVYLVELSPTASNKMDHLACFLPGVLALGVMHGMNSDHLTLAEEIAETCYQMYARMPTGLSPEIVYFQPDDNDEDFIVKAGDKHNLQRPEALESFFYLYRLTKNTKYQAWGWKIFQSFEKYSKVPWSGYVSIRDVKNPKDVQKSSKCESFWYSETLKYLFLLLNDDQTILPLNKYVFNTEGHPLPIMKKSQ